MATDAAITRPMRADCAAAYDRGVDGYINVWSAVILPPAEAVVAALDLQPGARVVDVGAGTGALVPTISAHARGSQVVALDASIEMLRAAKDRTDASVVHADALTLPIRSNCAHAVLMAYVLFHLKDPKRGLAEAHRVLRSGGTIGTVTWKSEATLPVDAIWTETLTEAGAPPLPPRRVDTGLDSADAVTDLLTDTGFQPRRIWLERLQHQWTADTYWQLVTGSGLNRLRLDVLDDPVRAETLTRAQQRLASLAPDDFAWSGEVVCAVATR
ncbi:MAG: class I SAM-dependent methyltransferase [Actinobacteria bacterium]|nr:MAG: class I SAM-dependent methyltransferase [Actinomycetota bacterium]